MFQTSRQSLKKCFTCTTYIVGFKSSTRQWCRHGIFPFLTWIPFFNLLQDHFSVVFFNYNKQFFPKNVVFLLFFAGQSYVWWCVLMLINHFFQCRHIPYQPWTPFYHLALLSNPSHTILFMNTSRRTCY